MKLVAVLLLALAADAAEVTRAARWHLHDSFWMSLHQTLIHDASTRTPRERGNLSADEMRAWDAAVAAYREAGGPNPTFSDAIMSLQDELTQVADDAVDPALRHPLAAVLFGAAPVYRAHWWPADSKANRFFIAYAAAMLRDAGEELVAAHERVYGAKFPEAIRVDVTPYAGRFGAYTHTLPKARLTVTVSSRDPGWAGVAALEAVLHESSHGVVHPGFGSVARAIEASAKREGIAPPRDLWHAILFATTSELTRRALRDRGVSEYTGFDRDLLTRAWPQYRQPIEEHWFPYVAGRGTLEEAIGKVVASSKQ